MKKAKQRLLYGEDSLTIWALLKQFSELLKKLEDKSDPDRCLWYYRPSFGRGKYGFGEFDAIIVTPEKVYLIESKWDKSSEVVKRRREVKIRKEQGTRHKIFSQMYKDWDTPQERYCEWNFPLDPDSMLCRNLRLCLDGIHKIHENGKIENILLLFLPEDRMEEEYTCQYEEQEHRNLRFRVVNWQYTPIGETSFITW